MTMLHESYWPEDTSRPVLEISVGQLLRDAAQDAPDRLALVSVAPDRAPVERTYAQLLDDAERAAGWLLEHHSPGDHVAVWAPNLPEWPVLQYGAALAGLVLVTLNPALRAAELEYAVAASDAVGLFHATSSRGTDMASVATHVARGTPAVRHAVALPDWMDEVRATPAPDHLPAVDPASPTQIQFTSGTTGRPKAAVLTHRAMVTNAALVRERCGARWGATFGTALPLFHTAGCGLASMGSVHQRATLVLGEVFDPSTMLEAIERHRVEIFAGVPLMLHALLQHPDLAGFDLGSLRIVMSGGDKVPPRLVDAWTTLCGASASSVYGQTELSPILCQTRPTDDPSDNLHTAGQPLPAVEVAIADPDDGSIRPLGHEGEIWARGYQTMVEYLGMPEATAATKGDDGWLRTGDLGVMDERGYVTVTGRLKDLIIRGGENISPREVEDALATHPALRAAAVLGRADDAWGETVAAVVVLDPDQPTPTATELHDLVRERLAPHKTPKSWYVATELPTNAMGKVQKFRLRETIEAGDLDPL